MCTAAEQQIEKERARAKNIRDITETMRLARAIVSATLSFYLFGFTYDTIANYVFFQENLNLAKYTIRINVWTILLFVCTVMEILYQYCYMPKEIRGKNVHECLPSFLYFAFFVTATIASYLIYATEFKIALFFAILAIASMCALIVETYDAIKNLKVEKT